VGTTLIMSRHVSVNEIHHLMGVNNSVHQDYVTSGSKPRREDSVTLRLCILTPPRRFYCDKPKAVAILRTLNAWNACNYWICSGYCQNIYTNSKLDNLCSGSTFSLILGNYCLLFVLITGT